MALSQEQVDVSREFHAVGIRPCDSKQGPVKLRRMGKTQRWKRQPERFRIPTKFGLYEWVQLTNEEAERLEVHALADCPVLVVDQYRNHAVGCAAVYEHPGSCLDAQLTTVHA